MAVNDKPTRQLALAEQLKRAVQRAGTLTVLHTNAVSSQIGLSATEFETIDIIHHQQPITAGQLARACGLSTGGITGLVDRLERKGFVQRQRDTADRRRVLISATVSAKKTKLLSELYQPLSKAFDDYSHQLSADQLQQIIEYYLVMNQRLEAIIADIHRDA